MADFQVQREQFAKDPGAFISSHMANLHMWLEHEQTSQTRMLNNVLKPGREKGKYGDSQFRRLQNADLGEDCVKQVLMHNFEDIQRYITSYWENPEAHPKSELFHMEFMTAKPDGTQIPDYIGLGYKLTGATTKKYDGEITKVEVVKTNSAACIIRPSIDNPDGWEITSAFPMVTPRPHEHSTLTSIKTVEKDFEYQLHNTPVYKNANPILQGYLDITCSGKKVDDKYRTVYSPKTDIRPPLIMIMPDFKHPEYTSEYPRITVYANQNPPANATLFLSKDKKMRLGASEGIKELEAADPRMAELYKAFIDKMPEEFRPVDAPVKKPESKPKPTKYSRHDPHFDNIAKEIEESQTTKSSQQELE